MIQLLPGTWDNRASGAIAFRAAIYSGPMIGRRAFPRRQDDAALFI